MIRLALIFAVLLSSSTHAVDWPGALERAELYSALIVGAKSRATQQALLVASFHDPEISPRGWHDLELDAARNRAPRP